MNEIQDCIKCDRMFEVTSNTGFHCVVCLKETKLIAAIEAEILVGAKISPETEHNFNNGLRLAVKIIKEILCTS